MSAEDTGGILSAARSYLARKLEPGTNTFVAGGGNDQSGFYDRHDRDVEQLERYEEVYERGGPVAALIDTRALMAFGTGAEFISEADDEVTALVDGDVMTVTEWLEDTFGNLDDLLVSMAKDAYIYGDALGEIVETRAGEFSHVELVNPKTMEPFWDDRGRIHRWEQTVVRPDGTEIHSVFPNEEIAHFKLQSLGRAPLGISLIEQNWDEIQRFARNQEAIENAMRLHGFPKYHIQVGREGQGQIPDRDLRRVRSRFNDFNEKTNWVTGTDIAIDTVDTAGFDVEGLSEHDLMILAAGFGVPEEMAGLGRGSTEATAKVRLQAFERNARAEQRTLADQFIEQIARQVIREYSPFPEDVDLTLSFGDVVSDQTATAQWLAQFREYYTIDEVREKLGDNPAPEDEELGPPGGAGGQDPFGAAPPGEQPDLDQTAGESATPDEDQPEPEVGFGGREASDAHPSEVERELTEGGLPEWVLRGEVRRDGGY